MTPLLDLAHPNLTRVDATCRAELLHVDSYDVELDITNGHGDVSDQVFRSRMTVTFTCREPGASTFIDLVAAKVNRAVLNGQLFDISNYNPVAGIALPDLAERNELTIEAECAYTNTGIGMHRFTDPADNAVYLYTHFEPADTKRVYACFDQPDLKAIFRFRVLAPKNWTVMSNGAVADDEIVDHGAHLVTFAETKKIAPYASAIVAGPFHRVTDEYKGISLGVACRASLAKYLDADEIIAITQQGFDFFQKSFDYPYAFDKYDQIFVPEFNAGAMENIGCVTFLEDYIFRSRVTDSAYERRAETILHEMAHMWFGNLVTMQWWDDLWLNESFATFASIYCQAEATKWRNSWTTFCKDWKNWAYMQDQLPSTHPIAADIPDVQSAEVNFDGITYAKGASVLKQLAAYVGIDAFLAGTQEYFRQHEFGNTTLDDLLQALAKASGRDLSSWSGQWLETAGVNTISADFSVDDNGKFTAFSLVQSAAESHPTLRSHRMAIGLYSGSPLQRVHRIELDVAGERTEIPELIGLSQPDLILINDDDLAYCKIRLDAKSLVTARDRINELSEPLPRTLLWQAAWDMTRDAEMPARDFLALVSQGIGVEDQIGVVQGLQRRAVLALTQYVDPQWTDEGWQSFANTCYELLFAAEPGSDEQLSWIRTLASAARSDAHLDLLANLLNGSSTIDGLVIDTDLRWTLLQALVALGRAGESEIAAELERDNTAAGNRQAATARALIPTPQAKAEAWRLATEDDSLPNATQGAVIRGFAHPTQDELVKPYVDRYFATVGEVWKRRPSESAQRVANGLFPSLIHQSTVDAADNYLANTDIPDPLRRVITERRAETVRALVARQCDSQATK